MDLLCCESSCECRAYPDPVLLNDERVLQNLLRTEERYSPSSSYFECVQKELTPRMRKIVAEWLLEVCETEKCQEEVFSLAMNYIDRFLSVCPIRKNQLQILGTACVFIASKLRETQPFSAEVLVHYTDNSITLEDLYSWELLVLSRLKWDISAVTPQDFLHHILRRLPVDPNTWNKRMILRHAQTFISLALRDYSFSMYTPSMISCASIAAALDGLEWTTKSGYTLNDLLDHLQRITLIEKDYLQSCLQLIEDMVTSAIGQVDELPCSGNGTATNARNPDQISGLKGTEYGKVGTPTDVRDIHF